MPQTRRSLLVDLLLVVTLPLIFAADYATATQLWLSAFYLFPTAVLSWRRGPRWGIAAAGASAAACLWLDWAHPPPGSRHDIFLYWDAAVRLAFNLAAVMAMTKLRAAREREATLLSERADLLVRAETVARLEAQLELRHAERLATVGKLAAGVAHELGTPLNVIDGRAKLISAGEIVGEEAAQSARIISTQVAMVTRVIRQLLDFARRKRPALESQPLAALVNRTLELLRPTAAKKEVQLGHDISAEIRVTADETGLQQILSNLVMNAVQAIQGRGEVRIHAASERRSAPVPGASEQDWLRIDVVDDGPGISDETRSHLFEPFFTTKPAGEGTGLGLSVSYGIARDHGGWIELAPRSTAGSRFCIYLPRGEGP